MHDADRPEFADVVSAEARVDVVLMVKIACRRVKLGDRPRSAGSRVGRCRAVGECDDAAQGDSRQLLFDHRDCCRLLR